LSGTENVIGVCHTQVAFAKNLRVVTTDDADDESALGRLLPSAPPYE
jgi:hypothetical protein